MFLTWLDMDELRELCVELRITRTGNKPTLIKRIFGTVNHFDFENPNWFTTEVEELTTVKNQETDRLQQIRLVTIMSSGVFLVLLVITYILFSLSNNYPEIQQIISFLSILVLIGDIIFLITGIVGGIFWIYTKINQSHLSAIPPRLQNLSKPESDLQDLHDNILNDSIDEVKALDRLISWAKINDVELPEILLAEYDGYYRKTVEIPSSRIIHIQQVKSQIPNLFNEEFWIQLRDVGVNVPILKSLGDLSILFEKPESVHLDLSKFFGDLVESLENDIGNTIGHVPAPLWLKIPVSKYKEIQRNVKQLMLDSIANHLK